MKLEANTEHTQVKKVSIGKRVLKFLMWSVISFVVIIGILVAAVFIYEDEIKSNIIAQLNKNLVAEVKIEPSDIDVTFISSFPKCALNFRNITILEALNIKQRDTLLQAQNLSLRFSIKDMFNKNYRIQQIQLEDGFCKLSVSKTGKENYIIWKTDSTAKTSNDVQFSLESILLKKVHASYKNKQQKVLCQLQINTLSFSGDFNAKNYSLESKANTFLEVLKVNETMYAKSKKLNVNAKLTISENHYVIRKAEIALNKMQFDVTGKFDYSKKLNNAAFQYKASNLDIATVLSLLPEDQQQRINDYTSKGEFYSNGNLTYKNDSLEYDNQFGIKNATVTYKPKNITLTDVNLTGTIVKNTKTSELICNPISAHLNANFMSGDFSLKNFNEPQLSMNLTLESGLKDVLALYPIDTISDISGTIKTKISLKGPLIELQNGKPSERIFMNGNLEIADCKVQFKNDPLSFDVSTLKLEAKENSVTITDFKLNRGKSDLQLNGQLPAFLKYVFTKDAPLDIRANLSSEVLNLDDFLSESKNGSTSSEIIFPETNHFLFDASIKSFQFGKFKAQNAKGNIELKNNKALLSDLQFETAEGRAEADALAEFKNNAIYFDIQTHLKTLNVSTLFAQLNNFGQSTLQDQHIKGYITADISFSGKWNRLLEPDLNSIHSSASIMLERGELINFKPLESLSKFVELNELKRIKFSTLESQLTIQNQIITIPKTSLKNSALNIEFWGTHHFDNAIDYHIQLLLSDLISKRPQKNKDLDEELALVETDTENRRSVFLLMTGTIDKPVIRYDKKGAKQKIKEDIKQEKQNLKAILKEEFGLFKKDSIKTKSAANPVFKLEKPNTSGKKKEEKKTEKEEDDDF
jgi:hypothetical protein